MNRSAIEKMPLYYDRYINLVDDIGIVDALQKFGKQYVETETEKLAALGDRVYAADKWGVKDIIQHIIDAERIFAYRALRIARADRTPLPGFDENSYALQTTAGERTLTDLLEELYAVRTTTVMLFKSFSSDMLQNEGISNGNPVSVLAIGFTITGHTIHHLNVIKERYYPLLNN